MKKFWNGASKKDVSSTKAICLSGTDSHRNWDGAIRLRRGLNNEKRRWESPIATTFSAFRTSSISTKVEKVDRRLRGLQDANFRFGLVMPSECICPTRRANIDIHTKSNSDADRLFRTDAQ